MKRIFTYLFVAVLLMLGTTSWAQIQTGKVYNFVNRQYGKSMSGVERDRTALAATDTNDYFQLWYVADGGNGTYTLRNLGNGYYLKGNGAGSKWPFVAEASNAKLYYRELSSGYCTFDADNSANSGNEMHYGSGNGCVVGWSSNEDATQWTATPVNVSDAELDANWAAIDAIDNSSSKLNDYRGRLENLFEDASCTVLKSQYRGYSDSQFEGDENYRNLPAVLQTMVRKVRDGAWGEDNVVSDKPAWDSDHSKRFRVQLYEPYSYAEKTAEMLGIKAHTNMNNPTGIVANSRDVLYVMVEDDLEKGAALYIQSAVDRERIGGVGGVQLYKGLNIIPYWGNNNQMFIQYVVDTYNDGVKTGHKLTDYEPLKIHIEGGCINGFFDTVGDELNPADTEADWDYYEARASQYNFAVMGKYVMWYMPLDLVDEPYDPNGEKTYDLKGCLGSGATSVFAAMDTWEALESAQRLAEGLLSAEEVASIRYASDVFEYTGNDEFYPSDYSKVFNNRSQAYSTVDGYFMFAGDKCTHYAAYTLNDVIRDIPTGGDPWGPSHEIGHTYQGPIQLPSTSETSNNALANISNYFISRTSSRLGSMQDLLVQFNNKTSYLGIDANSSNVWEKLMMYTKLWFYYHVAGNNKKFYPRLCEMFRRDPIEGASTVTGTGTMLKFYKYACMAAEEDLTDFFAAFGFFVPVDGVHSDDYAQYKTIMTQAEIDAAKAEVAAMAKANGWKKNTTILFIDDRIGTVIGADGTTVLAPRGDGGKEQGVLGSINDYDQNPDNDVAPLDGTYNYTITGSTMTMSGATGGTGFLVYDAEGNLVSFSNTYSFPLSEEAQAALATGNARVVVVKSDNSIVEIKDADATQTQINLLQKLLKDVAELLSFEDATETKVGWFKPAALSSLKSAYAQAFDVYETANLAAYAGVYSLLYDEFNNVATSRAAKVWFSDDRTYSLKNVGSGAYMKNDGTNVTADNTIPSASSASYLWYLQEGNYYQYYKVKNCSSGKNVQHHEGNNNGQIYTLGDAAKEFEIKEVSYGKFTIYEQGHKRYFNYQNGNVATWEDASAGSQWEITFVPTDETMAERAKLEELMQQAQELLDKVGNTGVDYEELPLQVTNSNAQYYLWTNAQDTQEGDIKYLVDNETGDTGGKFFHSNYHNTSTAAGYHYLEVDLGANNTNSIFKFAYTNRNNGNSHPDGIAVKVSNAKNDYSSGSVVYEVLSGLPQGRGEKWTSGVFETAGAYRYLHFKITADGTYWHMDEFDIYTPKVSIELFNSYSSIGEVLVSNVINVMMRNTILLDKNNLTVEELEAAYTTLFNVYDELLQAKENVDSEKLLADKETLEALIAATQELVNSCIDGKVTVTPGVIPMPATLQGTNSGAAYYLSCNALHQGNDNDSSADTGKLLDDNTDTYLHTAWKGSVAEPHYLLLDLGEGNSVSKFKFSYTTRDIAQDEGHPKTIKIEGSADNTNFEYITTIDAGLPNGCKLTYNSGELGNGNAYRYIRFTVTETYLHSTKPQSGLLNGNVFFYMSEFGFTQYTGTLSVKLSDNCGEATETMVLDAYRAMVSAEKLLAVATSAEQLQAAYSSLYKAYKTLYNAQQVKTSLKKLIDETISLKNSLYEISVTSYTATEIALQNETEGATGYIYCNAVESHSSWGSDHLGVVALLDEDTENHLHTMYSDYESEDGLHHYLRVDLGAGGATKYVEFGYRRRVNNNDLLPKSVVVEACNSLENGGEWTTIATLANLPDGDDEKMTGALGNGVAYRYWRFMVTETYGNGKSKGHPYFALRDFNVYKCTDVVLDTQLKRDYNPNIYIYTTTELVSEVEAAITAATEVYKDATVTAEDFDNAIVALQAEYDKLAEAIKYHDAPVRITTDEKNPVLYKIISKRDNNGGKVLQFDEPESNNVTIVDATENASYQAWYFMKGENGYLVKPFNGQGNVLGVETTSDGRDKALIAAEPAYAEWIFARSAVEGCTDYYYIYVNGTNHACLSHNGGFNATTKLGIWASGWNTNDGGSLFKFVDAEFENDNAHYYQLSDFAGALEAMTAATPQGTVVGAYEYGDAYDDALGDATTLREAGNTSDADECREAYVALRAAYKDIKQILPVEGKYYRINLTPGMSENDPRHGASMQIDDNAKLACGEYDASNARFYFTFEYDDNGNLYMKSLHTGTYLDEANVHNSNVQVGADAEAIENAKSIAINTLGTSNGAVVVSIVPTGGAMLNCTAKPGAVKAWDNAAVDKASAWVISEVEDLSKIVHTVKMNASFSSVMLGYNATLPKGVEAYNALGIEDGYVSLVKIAEEGGVIPANTPVILYRTDNETEKTFTYATVSASAPEKTVLGGSLYLKYVKCDENKDYYKLMLKDGQAKMYWMYKEFDAAGVSQGETNDGGHIKCSANKIYMALPSQQQAASYGMRFIDGETTGVEDVLSGNADAKPEIYDLTGRKVIKPSSPGIYVVNGKKQFLHPSDKMAF